MQQLGDFIADTDGDLCRWERASQQRWGRLRHIVTGMRRFGARDVRVLYPSGHGLAVRVTNAPTVVIADAPTAGRAGGFAKTTKPSTSPTLTPVTRMLIWQSAQSLPNLAGGSQSNIASFASTHCPTPPARCITPNTLLLCSNDVNASTAVPAYLGISATSLPVLAPDLTTVASNWNNLFGTLTEVLSLHGMVGNRMWTGCTAAGVTDGSLLNCDDWTSTASSAYGETGYTGGSTNSAFFYVGSLCSDATLQFYCVCGA